MKKKLLSILFVLGLLMTLPSVVSFAKIAASGTCGATGEEEVEWELDDSGTFTVRGNGAMMDYTSTVNIDWLNRKDLPYIKTVVIEEGVTKIGDYAFCTCENITSVTIARSVKNIGNNVFKNCKELANVYYAGTKDDWDGVNIGNGNDYLTNATLHYHCGATAGDNVYWALVGDTLTIGGSGDMADYADASSVPWNNSITAIKTVGIENGVTHVGAYAFSGCENLTLVTIPKSVVNIGNNAFNDCTNLDVYYTGTKAEWDELTKGSGNDSLTNATLHYYVDSGTCGATGNEDKVTWILDNNGTLTINGSGDMANYTNADEVQWKDSVADIKTVVIGNGVTNVGAYAFYNCTSLTSVTLSKDATIVGSYAFNNCSSLKSVTIPDDVKNIGDYAFSDCANLNSVTIPTKVTKIGDAAFKNCTKLTSVTIPNSVTNVGANVFKDCNKLADVYYTGTKTEWDGLTKGSGNDSLTNATLHYYCGATTNDNVYWALVDGTLTISGSGAMRDYTAANEVPWNDSIATIKTAVIENGVTHVSNYAFNGCTNLDAIYIPEGCSADTSAIPISAKQIKYEVEYTTKNKDKNIDDEKIVVITSVTKSDTNSIKLNCDSMGNGYYIIENEAGKGVELSTVCESNGTTHTGYSMRRREEITDKDHVYGCVIEKDGLYSRRCIDCGDVQKCSENGKPVTLGGLTYQCYTCGGDVKVVELNL